MRRSKMPTRVRWLSVVMTVIMLLPFILCTSGASEKNEDFTGDGVYRIRSRSTGQYLTAYLNGSKGVDKAYITPLDENNEAQIFLVCQNPDGSFVLWPQNDSANYCFAYSESTAAGSPVVKLLTETDKAYFDIFELSSGACTIAPTGGDNTRAVLGVTDDISYYSDNIVKFMDYSEDNASQQWYFERVTTKKMTFAFSNTAVKLYSTGKFYVRLFPYNYIQDKVKWSSSNEDVLMVGDGGRYCALSEGTATVTASVDGVSGSFTVTVSKKDAFTWYSQRSLYNSNWDGTLLTNLYFRSGGSRMRYAVDHRSISAGRSWMSEGCAICSIAMVLHNLGATLEKGYDFRSGQTGNLPADPYTASLANTYNFGATSENDVLYGDPILVKWQAITSQFFVDGKRIASRKVYNPSLRTIANLLKEHPAGLVVELKKTGGTHYVVFAECLNPDAASNNELRFIVYDPIGYTPEQGAGVLFERSPSCLTAGYGKWSINSLIIYDLEGKV